MNIRRIEIIGLFNTFNHSIEIKDSNLTILLGQNGLGKTAILSLISGLFTYDFDKLLLYQYNKLVISFLDGSTFSVQPGYNDDEETAVATLTYQKGREIQTIDTIGIRKNRNKVAHGIPLERYRRIRPDLWADNMTGEYYSTDEVISLNEDSLEQLGVDIHGCPEWLTTIINSTPVWLIDTKRLQTISIRRITSSRETVDVQDTIVEFAKDFTQKIIETKAKAQSIAADLDRSYPRRLLDLFNNGEETTDIAKGATTAIKKLIDNLQSLEEKRRNLVEVGLMQQNTDEVFNKPIRIDKKNEFVHTVLNMYIEDSSKKMDAYKEMSDKVSLFVELINKHFIKKELKVTGEEFVIISTVTKSPIPLAKLSSGEQHFFILIYNLLFKCPTGSFILMDEPEISLNIAWQKSFIQDLMRIMLLKPIDILMATHSPSIVRNYWENTVELSPEA